jgi:hypothetical protein
MTVTVWSQSKSSESQSAENLKRAFLASQPELKHPDILVDIITDLYLPGRQIDLVVLYHDRRDHHSLLKTRDGTPVHSFVQIIEVKSHSSDYVRFSGPSLEVRYNGKWHNATEQCDQQTYAFKQFQASSVRGDERLLSVFVQRAIWLTRVPSNACPEIPEGSSVPVHFAELSWLDLVSEQEKRYKDKKLIQAFYSDPKYHSLESLKAKLTHKITPTKLDLKRINALTKMRFDVEKTQYIQDLGTGLLLLRGRGGTGKTMSLIQIALHLARQEKKCLIITYNHGLISDITRLLYLIGESEPSLLHANLPQIKTRYSFVQDMYVETFGSAAEKEIRKTVPLDNREFARLEKLSDESELISKYDFVLVDEGQDWSPEHRDFLFKVFGPGYTVVADGVDQFVGSDRCRWDMPNIPINRRHGLKSSRRTKGATCQVVGDIAKELGIKDWDLEPDPEVHGGRFTVLVDPNAKAAVRRCLDLLDRDLEQTKYVRYSDNLICLPSTAMSGGMNYEALFDRAISEKNRDSWRGFDEKDRRQPVRDHDQLKAVRYNSCRGMEGWTTVCLGLDTFYDFQMRKPDIDREEIENQLKTRDGFLFSQSALDEEITKRATQFAVNWLMIPLTRSIDHLLVHIKDEHSQLACTLKTISNRSPGVIEWI